MRIIECTQLSPEWWEARRGLPTASEFSRILTPAKGKPSASQDAYLNELVGDIVRLDPPVITERGNYAMDHGRDTEAEARAWLAVLRGWSPDKVRTVGFCVSDDGRYGCSPDGLVEDDPEGPGGVELKCPQPNTQVAYLRAAADPDEPVRLPLEYKCQVHGCLLVTGRAWWDFCSYCRGFPPLVVRVYPDAFTKALGKELDAFCAKKDELLNWLRTVEG